MILVLCNIYLKLMFYKVNSPLHVCVWSWWRYMCYLYTRADVVDVDMDTQ